MSTSPEPELSPAAQNLPPKITWRVEVDEGDKWRHLGPIYPHRDMATAFRAELRAKRTAWADGSPIQYRLVREEINTWVEEDQ